VIFEDRLSSKISSILLPRCGLQEAWSVAMTHSQPFDTPFPTEAGSSAWVPYCYGKSTFEDVEFALRFWAIRLQALTPSPELSQALGL
jgi:hypothetical protein